MKKGTVRLDSSFLQRVKKDFFDTLTEVKEAAKTNNANL